MDRSIALFSCCLVLLTLPAHHHVEADTSSSLLCSTTIGFDRVLNTEASSMVILTAYRKDNLGDCLEGCCNQEWKENVDEPRGHCNLVTYYEYAEEGINNCFMVMCRNCSFVQAEGFRFAWVHLPNHHHVPDNSAIMPFIRHAFPPSPNNLPSIQSQSAGNLPPDMSPWQLFKSAISRSKEGAGSSMPLQRQRRNIEERADKASVNPEEKQDTPEEKPSTTTTTESPKETSTTVQSTSSTAKPLIIEDDTVTLPGESSSSTTSKKAETTSKKNEEPAPSGTKSSEQTSSVSQSGGKEGITTPAGVEQGSTKGTTTASKTVTNGASPKEGGVTNPPASGSTQAASNKSQTSEQGDTGNAPHVPETPEPQEEQASTKLKVNTDAKTTAGATSPKNKVGPTMTKPAAQKETSPSTTTKAAPEKVTEKPSTPNKGTEKLSTPKKPSVKPGKDEGTDGELVTDVIDVTEIIDETTLPPAKTSNHNTFTFHTNNFLLVLSLAIGVVLVIVVIFAVGRRWYEAYQRRHYNKVDYLINDSFHLN